MSASVHAGIHNQPPGPDPQGEWCIPPWDQAHPPPRADIHPSRHPPWDQAHPPEQTHTPLPPRTRHIPPEQTAPPGADTPQTRRTPQSRHPPRSRPPWESPPHPREADCIIRSTSGRYASYWNAFLLIIRLVSNGSCW